MMAQFSVETSEGVREYALRPRVEGDVSGVARWFVFYIGCISLVGFFYSLFLDVRTGTFQGFVSSFPFAGILLAIACLCIWGFLGLGPGAVSCQWSASGFVLRYKGGRKVCYDWSDPGFSCRIVETTDRDGVSYSLSQRTPFFSRPFLNPLPLDLGQRIVFEARQRGMAVTTSTANARGVSETTTKIRSGVARSVPMGADA